MCLIICTVIPKLLGRTAQFVLNAYYDVLIPITPLGELDGVPTLLLTVQ
jgi:hypothetical protein